MYANDDHLEVTRLILTEKKNPQQECIECFSPKLFHFSMALIFYLFKVTNSDIQIVIAQLFNCLASIVIFYYILLFLNSIKIREEAKLISFGLISFMPGLFAINIQATNDTFVILFSTLSLYYAYHFFTEKRNFFLMVFFAILSALSKLNGIILFFVIFFFLILKIVYEQRQYRKKNMLYFIAFLFLYLPPVFFSGEYSRIFSGKALYPIEIMPHPSFLKETYTPSPGVTSIFKAYFTFDIISLLRHPQITNIMNTYQVLDSHMTSLWSQLYGRTHFIQYSCGPFNNSLTNFTLLLGRMLFIFALIPTFIFIFGFFSSFFNFLKSLKLKNPDLGKALMILTALFYMVFIILVTFLYREFYHMKAIYIFPAIISFTIFFAEGLNKIYTNESFKLRLIITFICASLIFLYFINIISLIFDLIAL